MFGSRKPFPEDIYVVESTRVPWWLSACIGGLITMGIFSTIAEYRHKRTLHTRLNRTEVLVGGQIRETRGINERVKNINTWRQNTERAIADLRRTAATDTADLPGVTIDKNVRAA